MPATGNRFPKKSRLYLRNEIALLFERGRVLRSFPFNAHYAFQPSADAIVRMGISVPKKKMKRAVDRNRIKRLVREAFRTHNHEIADLLLTRGKSMSLMIVFTGNEVPDMKLVKSKIILILHRLSGVDEADLS